MSASPAWNEALREDEYMPGEDLPPAPTSEPADATDQDHAARAPWNDSGLRSHQRLSARFAQYAKGKCLYVNGTGWHYWDGARWAVDPKASNAYALLQELLELSYKESMRDKDLAADVRACMTSHGGAGVLDLASRRMLVTETDQDPYLLNCKNGTLDLHTLTLRSHDPDDLITKVTGCDYDPAAYNQGWEDFLESSLPNGNVRDFLQRYVGLALLGMVREHVMVIATGEGRNGKGVIARRLAKVLGDYAITASNDMLVASRYGQKKSAGELASQMRLRGARWVDMSELEEGTKLAESTMKSLVGGDVIEAKYMGENPIEFPPSHSIYMETNHLPKIDAESTAAWARIRVIPFDVSFVGREDHDLEPRLDLDQPAILTWAVKGLAAYQDDGLAAPAEVKARTASYRAENDSVQMFLDDRCETARNAWVTRSELHHAYMEWAKENGAEQLMPRQLTPKVRARPGVGETKRRGLEAWTGLGMKIL